MAHAPKLQEWLNTEVAEISFKREKWFRIHIQKEYKEDWMKEWDSFELDEEDLEYKAWVETTGLKLAQVAPGMDDWHALEFI